MPRCFPTKRAISAVRTSSSKATATSCGRGVLHDLAAGTPQPLYDGGRVDASSFVPARWDLLPEGRYMWGSVQTVRGCPKHCSFCSVWRTDGQKPRQRTVDAVIGEIVELRRRGYRFVALADDNFYPVTLTDLAMATRQNNAARLAELEALRGERFELMRRLAQLPRDMVFFTQITMEAAEDPEFLAAMKRANIKGALVGVESVTKEGLKDVYKGFNESGDDLVTRLRAFRSRRRARARLVHLRAAERSAGDVQVDAGGRAGSAAHLRAVRDADAVSGHGGLRGVGEEDGRRRPEGRQHPDHAALAHPAGPASEGLRAAPGDGPGRDTRADAGGVGRLLQPVERLGAIQVHAVR